MGDVLTIHFISVGVDTKKRNFSIKNLLNALFIPTINISRVAYLKWEN